jgi:hypothetical protein
VAVDFRGRERGDDVVTRIGCMRAYVLGEERVQLSDRLEIGFGAVGGLDRRVRPPPELIAVGVGDVQQFGDHEHRNGGGDLGDEVDLVFSLRTVEDAAGEVTHLILEPGHGARREAAAHELAPGRMLGRVHMEDRTEDLAPGPQRVVHEHATRRAEPRRVAAHLPDVGVARDQPAPRLVREHRRLGPEPGQDVEVVAPGEQSRELRIEREVGERRGRHQGNGYQTPPVGSPSARGAGGTLRGIKVRATPRRRPVGRLIAAGALLVSVAALAADDAGAGLGAPPPSAPLVFEYTGSPQEFVVPPGVTQLRVTVEGAQGGDGGTCFGLDVDCGSPGPAGAGAAVVATLSVTPGETLTALVAAQGGAASDTVYEQGQLQAAGEGGPGGFGYGTGGDGADASTTVLPGPELAAAGGGGGGSSALLHGGTALAVAAGGGGGGGSGRPLFVVGAYEGGVGGNSGTDGDAGGPPCAGEGGFAGTTSGPGGGGAGGDADDCPQDSGLFGDGDPGEPGSGPDGGNGGLGAEAGEAGDEFYAAAGGGGGGGLFGGGGGGGGGLAAILGAAGGGGGGSNLIPDLGSVTDGARLGDGRITVEFLVGPQPVQVEPRFTG